MMRIMYLDHEIGHRELQFVCPQPPGLVLRHETVPRTQELQNIGRLPDDQPSRLQKRRREGWPLNAAAFQEPHQRPQSGASTRAARHVYIARTGLLQEQSHELAASL